MPKRRVRELAPGYTSEVDTVTERDWYERLKEFEDANIYQTWSYAKAMWGLENTSHLVLKKDGRAIAVAQVRLTQVPLLKVGVAYVLRGPVWRLKETAPDGDVLCQALRALRNEYVCKRGLLLRLAPLMFASETKDESRMFREENYEPKVNHGSKMTILMDLSPSIEELRRGLHRNWKRNLKAAEAGGLEVTEGEGDDLFKAVIDMYREMVHRKAFLEPNDIEKFRDAQALLPDGLRMKVAVCRSTEGTCAGLIWSEIGDTAIELFAASRAAALANGSAYLLRWRLVEHLKRSGFRMYNLNGINQANNPGVYHFKSGLAGKAGTEIAYLGIFEAQGNALSNYCVMVGQEVLNSYRGIRTRIRRQRNKKISEGKSNGTAAIDLVRSL
jgi:lipid II:glycine glycyltransferase (peptidoglycan interpeptide bridge formation enzyme)